MNFWLISSSIKPSKRRQPLAAKVAIWEVDNNFILVLGFFDSFLKDKFVIEKINDNFNLSPRGIREMLNLNKPIYEKTAAYGHFGRMPEKNGLFSWEKTDKIKIFSK